MSKDGMSPEDKALFRLFVQTVKPLKQSKVIKHQPAKPVLPSKQLAQPMPVVSPEPSTIHLSDFYSNEVGAETILSWCRPGIPRKRFTELKQGRINWDSKLDLHGLRSSSAAQALLDFISQEQKLNHRCLLIIHGKGSKQREAPVLKNLVNHWLPQIPQVLAFHSALSREGGNGALYVLLKRIRSEDHGID